MYVQNICYVGLAIIISGFYLESTEVDKVIRIRIPVGSETVQLMFPVFTLHQSPSLRSALIH